MNSEKAPAPSSSVAGPSAETPSASTSNSDENRGDSFEGFTDDELAAFLVYDSPSESEESGKAETRSAELKAGRCNSNSNDYKSLSEQFPINANCTHKHTTVNQAGALARAL